MYEAVLDPNRGALDVWTTSLGGEVGLCRSHSVDRTHEEPLQKPFGQGNQGS